MMLIFDVINGEMLNLDGKVFEVVADLQVEIYKCYGIRREYQLLLTDRGIALPSKAYLSAYPSGTLTNPFFLFNVNRQLLVYRPLPARCFIREGSIPKTEPTDSITASIKIVSEKYQMIEKLVGASRRTKRVCERMIEDQKLQHKGWMAFLLFFKDLAQKYANQGVQLTTSLDIYMSSRDQYVNALAQLNKGIQMLEKMPILPGLLAELPEDMSLLQWITPQRIEDIAAKCIKNLDKFDRETVVSLCHELNHNVELANERNLNSLGKFEERLIDLRNIMDKIDIVANDQDAVTRFMRDEYDLLILSRDKSVYVNKCQLFCETSASMKKNNTILEEKQEEISVSRSKLSNVIRSKLIRFIDIQRHLLDVNTRIVSYKQGLMAHQTEFKFISQVHDAPQLYCESVAEVLRRKQFASDFEKCVSQLTAKFRTIFERENDKRREFSSKFNDHFLAAIFKGFDKLPTENPLGTPPVFDDHLPNLRLEDLQRIGGTFDSTEEIAFKDLIKKLNEMTM